MTFPKWVLADHFMRGTLVVAIFASSLFKHAHETASAEIFVGANLNIF